MDDNLLLELAVACKILTIILVVVGIARNLHLGRLYPSGAIVLIWEDYIVNSPESTQYYANYINFTNSID
ncbi:unnamed protein product [Rhizophagus irregularis]|nr:unnamed protein product [Rhizophagus irregularis]